MIWRLLCLFGSHDWDDHHRVVRCRRCRLAWVDWWEGTE